MDWKNIILQTQDFFGNLDGYSTSLVVLISFLIVFIILMPDSVFERFEKKQKTRRYTSNVPHIEFSPNGVVLKERIFYDRIEIKPTPEKAGYISALYTFSENSESEEEFSPASE